MLNNKVNFDFSIMKKLWDLAHEKLINIIGKKRVSSLTSLPTKDYHEQCNNQEKIFGNWFFFREQAKSCEQAKPCEQVSEFGFGKQVSGYGFGKQVSGNRCRETGVWIWFREIGVGKQASGNRCLLIPFGNRRRETGVLKSIVWIQLSLSNECLETDVKISNVTCTYGEKVSGCKCPGNSCLGNRWTSSKIWV